MEFSQHSGTIEFGKIRNRLMFCARFIELSKRERFECGGERALAKLFDRGLASNRPQSSCLLKAFKPN